ncbi:hypothetical protein [Marinomonas ostreistagni]|uniref:Autoinducer 2-binding periplasmic protein LuxP n=1 Tax=Marinomonas ostreistagni TaxID=359209 RepID=A0ABS0ZCF9_9GAMM|nr:hypothetical protein [Marinomonas ostreistagni]MBJ7551088.1 hypothetical protein [Marinomonas ostreistagni]
MKRFLLICFALLLTPIDWAYGFNQPSTSLQRYLEDNPNQLPLIEQLSVRVHSQPIRLSSIYPETLKIAVILRTDPEIPQNQAWFFAFKRRMQELNMDFRLDVFYVPRDEGTLAMFYKYQSIQATSFDYVIVDGVDDYNRPLIEHLLLQDGSKVIILNSFAPFPAWHLHPPLLYIGTDKALMMHRLASLLDRGLDSNAVIDAISEVSPTSGQSDCQMFLNELAGLGRSVRYRYRVKDLEEGIEPVLDALLAKQPDERQHFIFSCTPKISERVIDVLMTNPSMSASTNAWLGQRRLDAAHQQGVVMVTVLDMKDYMAIAAAEAIKADIELRLLPRVYTETVTFLTRDMDQQTRQLTFQQALQYSFALWPR